MLRRLTVENFVLIDRLDLELAPGLNIVTGETGAGKSILLGALGLLLGARAEGGALKDESRNCVVEGVFEIDGYGLEPFFEENDLEYDLHLVVRRVLSAGGKSRAYINDLPAQLTVFKELGARLIDIHSQHQSLMLGSDAFRCGILDSVAGNGALLARYGAAYATMREAQRRVEELRTQAEQASREEDYLRFQYEQLREAKLAEGEQAELEQQHGELSHAEQIQEGLAEASRLLDEEGAGVLPRLKSAAQAVNRTGGYYPRAGELHERLNSALLELRDVQRELSDEAQRIDADPARLQRIGERLDLIYILEKKHGAQSVEELVALREEYGRRLEGITSSAERIEEMERQTEALRAQAAQLAGELHTRRVGAAGEVKRHVEALLGQLGMPGAVLTVEVAAGDELRPSGGDTTRFLFSANRNAAPQPVEKVASGGEISRLMLALKSLVAERSMLPTIIFDEIDTGVSGRIADAMGEIICTTAAHMQVVNITHLPQVASKGQTHFVVYKEETPAGVVSRIRRLAADERVEEIAKMLSGSKITEAALAQARLLLGKTV